MRSEYRQDSQTAAEQLTLTAQLGNILIWVRNRNASPFVLSIEARQVYENKVRNKKITEQRVVLLLRELFAREEVI